jgi:hypothetical protein
MSFENFKKMLKYFKNIKYSTCKHLFFRCKKLYVRVLISGFFVQVIDELVCQRDLHKWPSSVLLVY